MVGATLATIVYFDSEASGHRSHYLQTLVAHSTQIRPDTTIVFAISLALYDRLDTATLQAVAANSRIDIVLLSAEQAGRCNASPHPVLRSWWRWQIANQLAREAGATHLCFLRLDDVLLPALFSRRQAHLTLGIYFRPTASYPEYGTTPAGAVRRAIKTRLIRRFVARTDVQTLFSFDRYFIGFANERFRGGQKAVWLAEPFDPPASAAKPGGSIAGSVPRFVLFGAMQRRKGVFSVLAALDEMTQDERQSISVAIIGEGEVAGEVRAHVDALVGKGARLAFDARFMSDEALNAILLASDVILAPYIGHIGSSGVVHLAAAFEKPILAPREGLVGRQVKEYRLGVTVDTASGASVRRGLLELRDAVTGRKTLPTPLYQEFRQGNGTRAFAEALLNVAEHPTL